MEELAAQIVTVRPHTPTLVDLLEGLNLARLDSFDATPVDMVLERAGVRTADDLLRLLRLTSVDAALTVLEWAQCSEHVDTDLAIATIQSFTST